MFCVYCGAKMHDKAKFCPKCGKPVAPAKPDAEEIVPVEEIVSAEENVTAKVTVFAEENVTAEETVSAEENVSAKETIFAEENVTAEETVSAEENVTAEETVSAEENVTAEETVSAEENIAAEEAVSIEEDISASEAVVSLEKEITEETMEQPVAVQIENKKPAKKKSLARKNLTAVIAYIVSAAAVAGLGLFVVPKLAFSSAFEKEAVSNSAEAAMTFHKAGGNISAASAVKFTIAKKALEDENYAYAAALFSELKNEDYQTEENLSDYINAAFGGRCRVLVNGGKYNLAEADSTQISDEFLRTSIVNDTLVSKAKILSSDGKTAEAYEMVSKVNTSAAYDSDSYNIIVYNYAAEFYNQMKFAEVYEILADATDEASIELRCSAAYYMANDFLKEKNYEKAIEMYKNAGDFSDAAERLKQCSYQLGLRYYNLNKLDTSLEYFTAADGYKEAASYIKKIEEKKAYLGWKIDGFTTDYVNTITGRPNPEKERIAATDPFIYYFTATNVNNNTNSITINVKITTPDGQTAEETFSNIKNGDVNCYIAGYEFPQHGALGRAYFTVTLVETGEVLDTCYFEIY